MIWIVWSVVGVLLLALTIGMLRREYFIMLDKRADEEYNKELDAALPNKLMPVFNHVTDRYELPEPEVQHVALHVGEGRVVSPGIAPGAGTNYGQRGPLYHKLMGGAMNVSDPYGFDGWGQAYVEEDIEDDSGNRAYTRFRTIKDQI